MNGTGSLIIMQGRKETILKSVIDASLPDFRPGGDNVLKEKIVDFLDDYLFYGPEDIRRLLPMGLYLLEISSIFFCRQRKLFSKLDLNSRRKLLERLEEGSVKLLRDLVTGIKGLIMFRYYSEPEVWKQLGFDPDNFIDENLRKREKHDYYIQ